MLQVHFLDFINKAQIKAAQKLSKMSQESTVSVNSGDSKALLEEEHSDFFQVIQKSKIAGITNADLASIWGTLTD